MECNFLPHLSKFPTGREQSFPELEYLQLRREARWSENANLNQYLHISYRNCVFGIQLILVIVKIIFIPH